MKNSRGRTVEPEWLDELPPQDPRALRSRRDLRRLNGTMRHPQIMARALSNSMVGLPNPRIVELGAGDGDFLLSVLRQLPGPTEPRALASGHVCGKPQPPGSDAERGLQAASPLAAQGTWKRHECRAPMPVRGEAVLVDRLDTVDPDIRNAFTNAGWHVNAEIADVFDWLGKAKTDVADTIICNLFLHHFQAPDLTKLLRLIAGCTQAFIALEPRRSWLPTLCGRFLWSIGCGSVTRHDAVVSIRAGFSGRELSPLWPKDNGWHIEERSAGWFSHLFIARRKE